MLLCGSQESNSRTDHNQTNLKSVGIDVMHVRWDTISGVFGRVGCNPHKLHVGNQGCTQKSRHYWQALATRVSTVVTEETPEKRDFFSFAVVRNPYDRVRRYVVENNHSALPT